MASNDSGVSAAGLVTAVASLPAQTENKMAGDMQKNHETALLQPISSAPVSDTAEPLKESKSESAVSVSSSPNIPSIPSSENVSQPTPSKSVADASVKVPADLASSNKVDETKEKETCDNDTKEEKPQISEPKVDQDSKDTVPSTKASQSPTEPAATMPGNSTGAATPQTDTLVKTNSAPPKPVATIKPMIENPSSNSTPSPTDKPEQNSTKSNQSGRKASNKRSVEDSEEDSDKRLKSSSSGSKGGDKTAEQILEYMEKTFEQRRKMITKQMPTIPELKASYPELFQGKQLLLEFQRITKIDIDQKIQEFCVRYATAVIEMARSNKAAAPVLARWEKAKQENETLKQYWDMVTALCLLPLHFGENFVEMVLEIEEDEEVKAQGKIVPTLVARGNIFRTDEFFLIAENTIVQEFEEFTIAFASLYSSYWVFNMVYPETIENTYNYIQRCIVRQREPGAISAVCKNFTKSLQKWNKEKEG